MIAPAPGCLGQDDGGGDYGLPDFTQYETPNYVTTNDVPQNSDSSSYYDDQDPASPWYAGPAPAPYYDDQDPSSPWYAMTNSPAYTPGGAVTGARAPGASGGGGSADVGGLVSALKNLFSKKSTRRPATLPAQRAIGSGIGLNTTTLLLLAGAGAVLYLALRKRRR